MDAVVLQKEWARMCKSYVDCKDGCPLHINGRTYCFGMDKDITEKRVEIVEKWSKEHPIITNGEKFEEVFGDDMLKKLSDKEPVVSMQSFIFLKDWWNAEYKEI